MWLFSCFHLYRTILKNTSYISRFVQLCFVQLWGKAVNGQSGLLTDRARYICLSADSFIQPAARPLLAFTGPWKWIVWVSTPLNYPLCSTHTHNNTNSHVNRGTLIRAVMFMRTLITVWGRSTNLRNIDGAVQISHYKLSEGWGTCVCVCVFFRVEVGRGGIIISTLSDSLISSLAFQAVLDVAVRFLVFSWIVTKQQLIFFFNVN